MSDLLKDPERLVEQADISLLQQTQKRSQPNNRANNIKQLIAQVDAKMKRYNKAYRAGAMELEQLQELMRDAKKRKVSYHKQLKKISSAIQPESVVPIRLETLCEEAKQVIDELDTSNQKDVIQDVVDTITAHPDNYVHICGHINLTKQPHQGLGSCHEDRDCRLTQRRQINSV